MKVYAKEFKKYCEEDLSSRRSSKKLFLDDEGASSTPSSARSSHHRRRRPREDRSVQPQPSLPLEDKAKSSQLPIVPKETAPPPVNPIVDPAILKELNSILGAHQGGANPSAFLPAIRDYPYPKEFKLPS